MKKLKTKSLRRASLLLTAIVLFILAAGNVSAEPGTPLPGAEGRNIEPAIEKIAPGVYRIGEIQIHKKARSITFPAQVNMDKGLLEYLLVQSQGKTHESLLRTDTDPYFLNIAFLLLGFEGTDKPLTEQGASEIPAGDPVEITIIYHDGNKNQRVPADTWIETRQNNTNKPVSLAWKYTGSFVMDGVFQAQVQGSIAAVYHDPTALIDHEAESGNNDEIWFVNEQLVPQAGTSVTVLIKAKN
ncbi:MAG: hypothetical protein KQH63_02925 [Desulfobulbaceae bacterium]|nr:hypothetical protein [Desulfobulbaceae bacterium]